MAFKRLLTTSEVNDIRSKMRVGYASEDEQLRLLGHLDLTEFKLREALEYFLSHTQLTKADRWPCPDCGRPDAAHELLTIDTKLQNGQQQIVGCWRCNMDSVIGEAERALEFPE